MIKNRLITCSSTIALAGALVGVPVLAQDGSSAQGIEEIVISASTGTSIRGVAPIGSSLIEVDREQIERSAATTTMDLLRETPQILNYGVTDTSRNGSGGAGNIVYGNAINLRGLGPYATLTLINGRRAVPQGTLGATIDPSNIPTIAVERIEVIADGASAVYGSDAIAGVANMILRRGYEGVGVDVQYGVGEDFDKHQVGVIAGKKWDSGQVTFAAQQAFRSNLFGGDRSFYRSDLTSRGGTDYTVTSCEPGNILVGGNTYAIPEGGATPDNLVAGTLNRCDNLATSTDIMPEQELKSAVFTFDQDLTDSISFFADGLFAQRDGRRNSEPHDRQMVVPETNAFFVAPAGVTLNPCPGSAGVPSGTGCETIDYSFSGAFGPSAISEFESEAWQLTAGFDFRLPRDWNLNLYATVGENKDNAFSYGNNINTGALTAALASSDPNTAFNPFGTGVNNPEVVDAIFNYFTDTNGKSKVNDYGIKVDGSLFAIPGGDVKLAAGLAYYDMSLRTGQIRGPVGNMSGTDAELGREVESAYAELYIPLVGEANAMPGIQSLVVNIAGRMDDYSDVGRTENPKFGINWEPVVGVKLHASYGESFRAPLLTQLTSAGGSFMYVQNYFDPTRNAVVRGVALSGGNLDLAPETAETFSFGIDYEPEFLPGAQFSLNFFDVLYEGQIGGQLANLNILRQEDVFSSIILRDAAAQARTAELLASGIGVRSGSVDEALNTPVFVDGRQNNLGSTETRGFDFGMVVPVETDFGGLRFALRGTWFDEFKVAQTASDEAIDQVNNIDYPLKLRMRGSLGWDIGNWDLTAYANYQNSYDNTLTDEKVSSYTTVDFTALYRFEDGVNGLTNGLKLGLLINNLFDRDPPFVDIAPGNNGGGGFDPQVANPIGRMVSVSLSKQF